MLWGADQLSGGRPQVSTGKFQARDFLQSQPCQAYQCSCEGSGAATHRTPGSCPLTVAWQPDPELPLPKGSGSCLTLKPPTPQTGG